MALKISTTCKTQGMSLTSTYIRISADLKSPGDKVVVKADWYADKAAYQDSIYNMMPVKVPYESTDISIDNVKEFAYDRIADGADVLQFAHDQYSAYLSSIPNAPEDVVYTKALIISSKITETDL